MTRKAMGDFQKAFQDWLFTGKGAPPKVEDYMETDDEKEKHRQYLQSAMDRRN